MVEPTHLKNISQNGKSSPIFGVKIQKIFELPPPRFVLGGSQFGETILLISGILMVVHGDVLIVRQ